MYYVVGIYRKRKLRNPYKCAYLEKMRGLGTSNIYLETDLAQNEIHFFYLCKVSVDLAMKIQIQLFSGPYHQSRKDNLPQ